MTNASPSLKAAELFNALALITLEDVEAAKSIVIQARILNKQLPGDFTTKVAFGESLLLSGERSKAVEQLHAAFALRDRSNYTVMDRLALLLAFVGDRGRALKVTEEVAFLSGVFDNGEMSSTNHAQIAAWAGDLDLLNRLNERDNKAGSEATAKWFLDVLQEIDANDDFILHQRLLIDSVHDVQVAMALTSVWEGHDVTLINNIIFDRSAITRSEIEDRVEKAILSALGDRLDYKVLNVFTASPETGSGHFRVISNDVLSQ